MHPVELSEGHQLLVGELPAAMLPDPETFELLWSLHPTEFGYVRVAGGGMKLQPRWQKVFGLSYKFSGVEHPAETIPPALTGFLDWASNEFDGRLNSLVVNWYDRQFNHYIGAHRDEPKQIIPAVPIVMISLGETRAMRLRPWRKPGYLDFPVTSGTVIVLPYVTNLAFTHEILRRAADVGRRISVTVRGLAPSSGVRSQSRRNASPSPASPSPLESPG